MVLLQVVMERFPISLIKEPTAFTSNDPMEIYNNILVFVVDQVDSRSEMHIFQVKLIDFSLYIVYNRYYDFRCMMIIGKRISVVYMNLALPRC